MSKLVTRNFGIHVADVFKKNVTNGDDQFYVFYSKIDSWPSESSPPTPNSSIQFTEYDIWRNMLSMKKVSNNDVSFATNRYDWSTNTVYSEYNNLDGDLFTRTYFVYTDDNNVYKCLFNNQGGKSTVKPTGQSTSILSTADGYRWKFMYNVSTAEQNKFQSTGFIPVKTLTSDDTSVQWDVQQAAANGSVDIIDVAPGGGSNYLVHKGTIAGVTNTSVLFLANTASGVDNAYKDYTLFISSGAGTGQIQSIKSYSGPEQKITLNSPFTVSPNTSSTYHVSPAINIFGDGSGAKAYANVASGSLTKINVIDGGSSYSHVSANVTHYGTFGLGANLTPYLSPPGGHGSDPVSELNGRNVVLNVKIDGEENKKFVANNDFRIFGVLKNPVVKSTGSIATDLRYRQTTRLNLANTTSGTFLEDEFVTGSSTSAKGRVVTFDGGLLHLTNVTGSFNALETITANTSGATATINTNGIAEPQIAPYRGDVLYIVTQSPISRDIDQSENITLTVKF